MILYPALAYVTGSCSPAKDCQALSYEPSAVLVSNHTTRAFVSIFTHPARRGAHRLQPFRLGGSRLAAKGLGPVEASKRRSCGGRTLAQHAAGSPPTLRARPSVAQHASGVGRSAKQSAPVESAGDGGNSTSRDVVQGAPTRSLAPARGVAVRVSCGGDR